ncbi:MAG TPA: hypothetical protein VHH73_15180 [Verrucomicrobiae bacterium]|nr:hypothetical protein [Verrucomicrobiae bacterium]
MDDKLNALLARIKQLESELVAEIKEKERKFGYEVRENKVRFKEAVLARHRQAAKSLARYLREARLFSILSAPVIWFCIVPVVFMHLVANAYQFICFPIYGIPKVRRRDYIIMDRRRLRYLNSVERFNCVYCEYVNGLLAYVQEIAGRTEQYWCPIKHAVSLKTRHSRYPHFLDYGDAEHFRQKIESVRRDFDDLKKPAGQ